MGPDGVDVDDEYNESDKYGSHLKGVSKGMDVRTGPYKEEDDDFDEPDGTTGMSVVCNEEKDEDIDCGEEDAGPYRECGNEQGDAYCRAEELCEIGRYNCEFGEDVEGIQEKEADESGVFWMVMEENAAMCGKVWKSKVSGREREGRREDLDR